MASCKPERVGNCEQGGGGDSDITSGGRGGGAETDLFANKTVRFTDISCWISTVTPLYF
jgi:hypothetical protein